MAKTRKVIADLGSEQIKLMMEQINRLTAAVEALKAAIVTDEATIIANVAALDHDDFEELVCRPDVPAGRRIPTL